MRGGLLDQSATAAAFAAQRFERGDDRTAGGPAGKCGLGGVQGVLSQMVAYDRGEEPCIVWVLAL